MSDPSIDEIIKGDNISNHYLGEDESRYKIFRSNGVVYAVRYEENTSKPNDFIPLWQSNKGKNYFNTRRLGVGVYGVVDQKTLDKAVKSFGHFDQLTGMEQQRNRIILDQHFILKDNKIEKYFVLGLWNVKNPDQLKSFIMPVAIINKELDSPNNRTDFFNAFIPALRKLNDLGYRHPDLANGPHHSNPANLLITKECIKLVDLDSGFENFNDPHKSINQKIPGRDQWIYVYNQNLPSLNKQWSSEIRKWYKQNPGKSLSEDPQALLELCKEKISLPKSIVEELKRTVAMNNTPPTATKSSMPFENFKAFIKNIRGKRSDSADNNNNDNANLRT